MARRILLKSRVKRDRGEIGGKGISKYLSTLLVVVQLLHTMVKLLKELISLLSSLCFFNPQKLDCKPVITLGSIKTQ